MELLSPKGLLALGLLAPLVVLYILKIKRQRRVVPSTWLWSTAQRDLLARSPFKKLVAQVPLLLQAIVLLALAFALARPATRGREIVGDHIAIVVDVSASMATQEPDPSGAGLTEKRRIDLAKEAARDIVGSLMPGSDALVLEAGREARVVAPLDRDPRRLRAAVDRIRVQDVEGDLGGAVALAVDRMRQLGGSRRILVLTDGNLARPEALAGAALPLEVVTVGTPAENAGIVRVDVRSGSDPVTKQEQVQAFLVVANYGRKPRELFVTMRQENASDVLASRRVLVAAGEKLPVVVTFHPTAGDYLRGLVLDIAPHDALPVDDVAFARVPAGEKIPVFLVGAAGKQPGATGSSPWLERALAADPMVDLKSGSLAALAAATDVAPDALVVVDGACPPSPPGGDLLVVNPPPGPCFGTLVGRSLDSPRITSWENGDARMRFLTLDGVHVVKASALKPDGSTQELVRTQEGTIVTDISTATRFGTLVGFDVGDSDWPLKASFVLFIRNVLEQARAHRAHGMAGPARAGEPMRVNVPASATRVAVDGPDGVKSDVVQKGGLAVVPDIPRVGLYHVSWQGPQAGSLVVPANLTSEAESNLSPRPIAVEPGKIDVQSGSKAEAHNEWTWMLALIALFFVVADVWWFTRAPRATPLAEVTRPRAPERS